MSSTELMQLLNQSAVEVAPQLLGYKLIHESPEGTTSGYIVETEAYTADDPASHSYKGQTIRNHAMFQAAGTWYVYFIYGAHYCLNLVTGDVGQGEAVLIRALEPLEGIELMQRRRGHTDVLQLTNGPAKLVQAMGIQKSHNLTHLTTGSLRLEPGFVPNEIARSPRVGIKQATGVLWRFYVPANPYVSRSVRYT